LTAAPLEIVITTARRERAPQRLADPVEACATSTFQFSLKVSQV